MLGALAVQISFVIKAHFPNRTIWEEGKQTASCGVDVVSCGVDAADDIPNQCPPCIGRCLKKGPWERWILKGLLARCEYLLKVPVVYSGRPDELSD